MKEGWSQEHDGADATHVYPLNDLKEHELSGKECWCKPRIECHGKLIVHSSADGRERKEMH